MTDDPKLPPRGQAAVALGQDILALAHDAAMFRTAYMKLIEGVDALAQREPYGELVADLQKEIERKAEE